MTSINSEITRLETLCKYQSVILVAKLMPFKMLEVLTDEQKQEKKAIENYYKCAETDLAHKIKFMKQYLTGEIEANMLTERNELMMEWIEASWEVFGQANIKKDGERLKEEYNMFKAMFDECKIKEKAKKKTRRGGKKHKK